MRTVSVTMSPRARSPNGLTTTRCMSMDSSSIQAVMVAEFSTRSPNSIVEFGIETIVGYSTL